MTRTLRLALASLALTSALLILHAVTAFAQSAKDLVGTWQLVSNVIDQNGKKIDQFGPNPHGILISRATAATCCRSSPTACRNSPATAA